MKKQLIAFASLAAIVGCAPSAKIAKLPLKSAPAPVELKEDAKGEIKEYSKEVLKSWPHQPLVGVYPSMDLAAAYELVKDIKPQKVIAAVVDSGIDINHEDLKDIIWTNTKEIPNNGIDDDKNGYVDDVHGWNFLGNVNEENIEFVRIVRDAKDKNSETYKKAYQRYEKERKETQDELDFISKLKEEFDQQDKLLQQKTGKKIYTKQDIASLEKSSEENVSKAAKSINRRIFSRNITVDTFKGYIDEAFEYYDGKMKNSLNLSENFRAKHLNDNPYDINDKYYGDNNVIGPDPKQALHGTHVAGIIAAVRGNGIGMDGVANATIMPVRAVPDGDEYDKDIALAIRYAVDNGAKVINGSFGKDFSPNKEWVREALKYAAEKDVLVVHAAGNDSRDNDKEANFPDDNINGVEYTNNVLTIGALNYKYNQELLAEFSNYGKNNVDIFAPGVDIYATVPSATGEKYKFLNGTSMASPEAAGLAVFLRSYFPKLTAVEVKEIIMASGVTPKIDKVIVGENIDDKRPMSEVCKSGKIINAYNAVILAAKKTMGK